LVQAKGEIALGVVENLNSNAKLAIRNYPSRNSPTDSVKEAETSAHSVHV
jgi:hypothetical protein